ISTVADWPIRFIVTAAQGCFRAAIRCHPDKMLWSCALEWNTGMRVVAFFGNQEKAFELAAAMPSLYGPNDLALQLPDGVLRYREEVSLAPEDDVMFA